MSGQPSRSGWTDRVLAALAAALFFSIGLSRTDLLSRDALVYEGACRAFLDNTTEGRQALVGSAWWPPLHFLLRLPLAAALPRGELPLASLAVSALGGAAVLALLMRMLQQWRFGWLRIPAAAALVLHPPFLRACCDGSAATTFVALALLTARGAVQWAARRQVGSLIYLGLGSALLSAAGLEALPWLFLVVLTLLLDTLTGRLRSDQKEAVVILALLPLAYALGLWMLADWLVMGDALHAVRPLLAPWREWTFAAPAAELARLDYIAAGACGFVLLFSFLRGDRAGSFAGALGVGVAVAMLALLSRELLWAPSSLALCLLPMTVAAAGYLGDTPRVGAAGRAGLSVAMVALCAAGSVLPEAAGGTTGRLLPPRTGPGVLEESAAQRQAIETRVCGRARYPKVFACGYEGFALLWNSRNEDFARALDFRFTQAREDYAGHDLYLLLSRPTGRAAMESVFRRYDAIYLLGADTCLYDGSWGDWRLFEIVQAPRRIHPARPDALRGRE